MTQYSRRKSLRPPGRLADILALLRNFCSNAERAAAITHGLLLASSPSNWATYGRPMPLTYDLIVADMASIAMIK